MLLSKGNIIVIAAASGTGKTSLLHELIKLDDKIHLSISYTSRKKRENEINGKHYFFIKVQEFKNYIVNGFFLEYAKVHNNYYGTSKEQVFNKINSGEDIILEIDVQGAFMIKNKCSFVTTIFILPPSLCELERRLYSRGSDNKEIIDLRLHNASEEIKQAVNFDYIIINDNFSTAVKNLYNIICCERLKADNNKHVINEILKLKLGN